MEKKRLGVAASRVATEDPDVLPSVMANASINDDFESEAARGERASGLLNHLLRHSGHIDHLTGRSKWHVIFCSVHSIQSSASRDNGLCQAGINAGNQLEDLS